MKKIPTVFKRDPDDMKRVLPEVTPGCEWVLAGEGTPTRKYDGTCVLVDNEGFVWCRREVKPGKEPPTDWQEVDHDEVTGKRVGWEPWQQSGFAKWVNEAVNNHGGWDLDDGSTPAFSPGTYELVGPKVQGNPEDFLEHCLVLHGNDELDDVPRTFDDLRALLTSDAFAGVEGIVWHHPDGRMAKLKVRDFPSRDAGAPSVPTIPRGHSLTTETQ